MMKENQPSPLLQVSTALAVALPLALMACASVTPAQFSQAEAPRHISVERERYQHSIALGADGISGDNTKGNMAGNTEEYSGGYAGRQADLLAAFLRGAAPRYGDRFTLRGGDERIAAQVDQQLGQHGFRLSEHTGYVRSGQGADTAILILERHATRGPDCGHWREERSSADNTRASAHFGCATNQALASMIADPRHLLPGQAGADDSLAEIAGTAVSRLRGAANPAGGAGQSANTGGSLPRGGGLGNRGGPGGVASGSQP